jgi:hypothetical protein
MNVGVSFSEKIETSTTAAVYEAVDIVAPLGSIQCPLLANHQSLTTDY